MQIRMNRFLIPIVLAAVSAVLSAAPELHAADGKLKVIATTAFFADLVRQIGKDNVEVKYVASPKFNVHFIAPRPSDVRNTANADLFVHAGLDIEAWVEPLLDAAGKPALFRGGEGNVDLSEGIPLLKVPPARPTRAEGDIHLFGNPHYTLNPENSRIMARTILARLKEKDPSHAAGYEAGAAEFLSRLDGKIAEWKARCAGFRGAEIISYHDDIAYFADFLGLKAEQFIEPKPGIPPTPRHLQFLEEYARANRIKAIVMPTYFPRDAADALAGKIGVRVVTICQNAGELAGTDDVFNFFDFNVKALSGA